MVNSKQKETAAQTKRHWVRLTRMCNNKCMFCLDKEAQDGSFMALEEIRLDLQKGRDFGIKRVVLSGGEPALHPEFLDIVGLAKELGYTHIQVITNGRMFAYPQFLRQAVKNGVLEITFSIHGHTDKLHDQQTQVVGSFAQSLKGLTNALQIKGLIISVDVVINKINVNYLKDILEFFINLGVYEFDLLQIIPFGRAWDNREKLFYNLDNHHTHLKQAFQLSKNQNLHIWTNRFPAKYLEGFEDLIQHPVKLYDEIGGRRDMFDEFIKNGEKIDCRGERCQYCFLEDFCGDLVELKDKGKLVAHANPFCLKELNASLAAKKHPEYILRENNSDIFKFLSFYIMHRYFLKGLRCEECKFNQHCAGMQCDYIRRYGFQVLEPILNKRVEDKQAALKKNFPYNLLRLSLACNANCLFCNVPPESYPLQEMSTQQAKAEIDRLVAFDGELRLDITGGEPTLRRDLEEIIRYASEEGAKAVQVQSNGIVMAEKEYVKKLKSAGLNQGFIALHSSIPEIHDYLVGKKGAFKKCIRAIENLLENNIQVSLNPVITSKSYEYLPDFIEFIKKKFSQIQAISLSVIQPRGRAGINKYLIPRYSIISPYIRKGLALAQERRLTVYNPYCGVPLCIGGWHYYLEQCVEYCQNLLKPKIKLAEGSFNEDKVKGPGCRKCDLNNLCNGVWKEYAAIYSFSDLKPIKLEKNRR